MSMQSKRGMLNLFCHHFLCNGNNNSSCYFMPSFNLDKKLSQKKLFWMEVSLYKLNIECYANSVCILTFSNLPLLVLGRVYIACVWPSMVYGGKTNDSDLQHNGSVATLDMWCQSHGWHIFWGFAGQFAFV